MRGEDLNLEELLELRPQEGKILIKNTRVLIFNADAMGTLRKDLISSLGFERAKSFLIRYGWNCGYNDALSIKDQFDWDNELEWKIAGIVLHCLEGHTKVKTEFIKFNREEKKWLLKGQFINSFEAEQHLRFFGVSDSPVCWHLIGYASGYGTAFLGRPVFYKEHKCVGKGDPYCEFYGKNLEDWGDEILSELPYYAENKISEELEAAYRRIDAQNKQLKNSFDVHKRLTDLVLKGEGLHGITETLAQIINGTVFVLDKKAHILATSSRDGEALFTVLRAKTLEYLKSIVISGRQSGEYEVLVNNKKELRMGWEVDGLHFSCIFTPILAGSDILGFVAAIKAGNNELDINLLMSLERATNVYALEMLKQKAVSDLEQQLRGEFLDSLLSENVPNEESLVAWGLRLGHDITRPHNIIVMDTVWNEPGITLAEERNLLLKKEILHITESSMKNIYPLMFCGYIADKVVILLPDGTTDLISLRKIVERIKRKIEKHHAKIEVSFGAGCLARKVQDYRVAYQQALKALEIINIFDKQDRIVFFEELGSIAVLLDANNKTDLKKFMLNKLEPLMEYDRKYNLDLIQTLEYYLETDSIRKTSKKISISTSGLKYRLNKIKEFGYNLQSPQEKFDMLLALKIYRVSRINEQQGCKKPVPPNESRI